MRISDWSSDVCSSDLPKLDLGSAGAAARVDVPLAVLAPAKADRSVRRDHVSAALVQRDGLPVRFVGLPEPVGDVRGAPEAPRHETGAALLQQARRSVGEGKGWE